MAKRTVKPKSKSKSKKKSPPKTKPRSRNTTGVATQSARPKAGK